MCEKHIVSLCNKSKLSLNSLGSRVDWNSFVLLFVLLFSLESDTIICWDFLLKKYASLLTCWLKNLTNTEECKNDQILIWTKEISEFIIENIIFLIWALFLCNHTYWMHRFFLQDIWIQYWNMNTQKITMVNSYWNLYLYYIRIKLQEEYHRILLKAARVSIEERKNAAIFAQICSIVYIPFLRTYIFVVINY